MLKGILPNFQRKIRTILSINSTFLKLETQNDRLTTRTALIKNIKQKTFLEPGAFSD